MYETFWPGGEHPEGKEILLAEDGSSFRKESLRKVKKKKLQM